MANITPLFSTPIYQSQIEPISAEELDYIISLEYEPSGLYSKDKYILEHKQLSSVKTKVMGALNQYVYDALRVNPTNEFYITNSWVVKHEKGCSAQLHRHDNSLLSGVLYIQTDDNSGEISFDLGVASAVFPSAIRIEYTELNLFNSPSWAHYPYDNDILIFPSHVLHKVAETKSDKTRYSLAFNAYVRGKLGDDMSVLDLK